LTKPSCQNCGEPAARPYDGWTLCEKCALRFEEYDRNAGARDAGLLQWNVSRHDPFWRAWLTSRELFDTIRQTVPRVGTPIHSVLGGDVFEWGRGQHPWVQVWVAPAEVVVAYASNSERYGRRDETEGLHELEGWIEHLRHSEPLELGRVRGRSSYGALSPRAEQHLPTVKWAQAGDWAALARGWFVGDSRQRAPWP
jgi:hypothetical protein